MKDLLTSLGISLTQKQNQQLLAFMDLLLEYNQKFNLTSIVEPQEVRIKHFYDSLLLVGASVWPAKGKVADLGTGAGFPGIPLKIVCPDIELVLMDASAKKIGFINVAIEQLGLNKVEAIHIRAEDAGQSAKYRESFDWLVTRALAPMPVLAEYALPLVKVGGYMAAYKGPGWQEELTSSQKAISLLGGVYHDVYEKMLPEDKGQRSIVFISKIKDTSVKYPRKSGTPSRQPLM